MRMRTGDPMIVSGRTRHLVAIAHTLLLPATLRIGDQMITAIAAQTPDERSTTLDMPSGGETRGEHMRLRTRPIPVLHRIDTTTGAVSQRATGRVLRRVSKATTTRAVPNHATTGRCIRSLRRQVHAVRPEAMNACPCALIAMADPRPCISS